MRERRMSSLMDEGLRTWAGSPQSMSTSLWCSFKSNCEHHRYHRQAIDSSFYLFNEQFPTHIPRARPGTKTLCYLDE